MNQYKRKEILQLLEDRYRDARIELHYETHFQLLLAVLLSAQATDISVNKATKGLFKRVREPKDIQEIGVEQLKREIKTIGLYNSKAKHIMRLSEMLLEHHDGVVPNTRSSLESLPGVGRKTANVILNELFDQPTIAVDTHIFRVCNRTKLAIGKTPEAVEEKLMKCVPYQYKRPLHQWLIQLGRYTCLARKPNCNQCVLVDLCEYKHKLLI